MSVELWLKVLLACLCALGSLSLALGENNSPLAFLSVALPAASFFLVDYKGWFQLSTTWANIGAFLALVFAARDLERVDPDKTLLAMAHLLIYLQFVLLFKRKTVNYCWILAFASLLEVAVASALGVRASFGAVMLIYTFLFLATLVVLGLHRERVLHAEHAIRELTEGLTLRSLTAKLWQRKPAANGSRTVFVGQSLAEPHDAGLNLRLVGQILSLGLASLAMTCVGFAFVPRYTSDGWEASDSISGPLNIVGYSATVELGEIGETIESPESVLNLRLFDLNGQPYAMVDEPLIRGSVLVDYVGHGRWQRSEGRYERELVDRPLPRGIEVVRQEITISPLDTPVLFSIYPPLKARNSDLVRQDLFREELVRGRRAQGAQLTYDLYTLGVDDHRMRRIVPMAQMVYSDHLEALLNLPYAEADYAPIRGLMEAAEQVVGEIDREDVVARAAALETYLSTSGGFSYSLSPVERNAELDPVEDFVTSTRKGHCEYFASALVLMLRSVGIPARMVYGFKGGDWNDYGSFYQVRQLHAHTWVEAYIADPPIDGAKNLFENGAWMVLDPTAYSQTGGASASQARWLAWLQLTDYVQFVWTNYIAGLDAQRQYDLIYKPIADFFAGIIYYEWWAATGRGIVDALNAFRQEFARGEWFSWRGGLAAMALMLVLAAVAWLLRKIAHFLARVSRDRGAAARRTRRADIEFYRRYEQLMARYGRWRPHSQTQREFARAIGSQLTEFARTRGVAPTPARIADLFYRVRFGGRPLDNQETLAVESALSQLDDALAPAGNRRG